MKLSTRGRYGVRLMFDLALHEGDGPVTLKDIAARQEISEKYLSNLIPLLKNAGLVHSVRGSRVGILGEAAPGNHPERYPACAGGIDVPDRMHRETPACQRSEAALFGGSGPR